MAAKTTLEALDFLSHPEKHPAKPVCVCFGDDLFLRRQVLLKLREAVLQGDEDEFSFSSFPGKQAEWRDVHEELNTIAMFGGGQRLACVEEADEFVTRYRPELEDYAAKPSRRGVLVLDLGSFPSNTRLYKAIAADGLLIDCSSPTEARLTKWLIAWTKKRHAAELLPAAADALVETIGPELGLLDQELAKLTLTVGEDKKITAELVSRFVGGWRAKTTWEMLDAALDGKPADTMLQLDRLLASGEQPIAVLAQISASLRRLASATRILIQSEAAGRRIPLGQALEQAGVRSFVVQKSERQLRRLGRKRGAALYEWLLDADLALKGDSQLPPRLILERLLLRIAAPADAVLGK